MHLHQMRPVPFYIRIYTVFRQVHATTDTKKKKTQSKRKSSSTCGTVTRFWTARDWRCDKHTEPNTHTQTHGHGHSICILSLDKSRRKKVHVSNVIYAFGWRHSNLILAAHKPIKSNCNFAVFVQLLNFLAVALRTLSSGRLIFRTAHICRRIQLEMYECQPIVFFSVQALPWVPVALVLNR